jgi:Methyltransferase domain
MNVDQILEPAWTEYLSWLFFAVPGTLMRGNVDSIAYALGNLPDSSPILEIGSFCGPSTCVIDYFEQKLGIQNRLYTVDSWTFEGAEPGASLGDSPRIRHEEYRNFVKESFDRNIRTFCHQLPFAVEMDSGEFFKKWANDESTTDVFGRMKALGGPISFAYIDGNHSYGFARRDFENVDRFLVRGGFILFDDSADGSEWEVCKVVQEVLRSGAYGVVAKNPNYLLRRITSPS